VTSGWGPSMLAGTSTTKARLPSSSRRCTLSRTRVERSQ
jgi:hypothetical protein